MGEKLTEYIGGEYINAEDVAKNPTWAVLGFEIQEFDGKVKLKANLESVGVKKDMTLNKINSEMLIEVFGDDTDLIIGKVIVFKIKKVEVKGKLKDCIRVDMDATKEVNNIK